MVTRLKALKIVHEYMRAVERDEAHSGTDAYNTFITAMGGVGAYNRIPLEPIGDMITKYRDDPIVLQTMLLKHFEPFSNRRRSPHDAPHSYPVR